MKISAGTPHAEVEPAIESATTTIQTLALGFHGDVGQADKVFARLNQISPTHADAFRDCKEGVHGGAFATWTERDFALMLAKIRDITQRLS